MASRFYLFALVFSLGSCTQLPLLPSHEKLPIDRVVDTFECELQDSYLALRTKYKYLDDWAVGIGFTLIAEDFSEFSPTLNLSPPLVRGLSLAAGEKLFDTLSVAVNGDFTGRSRRTINFKLAFNFVDLLKFECPRHQYGSSPLTSSLGIYETMYRVLSAISSDGVSSARDVTGDPLSIGTTIQFIVTSSGRLTPSASLGRLKGPGSIDPSGFLFGTRSDDHTLDISMYPRPVPPPPAEVVIVRRR